MKSFIRVMLVDDHAVVREGYRRLLERCVDMQVVAEADSVTTLLACLATQEADVVVMDIALPGSSGIEGTRKVLGRHPQLAVLISSMYEDAVFPARALAAGALGYVTKASAPEVLLEGIRRVALRQRYLSADVADALTQRAHAIEPGNALSPREFEILRQLVAGCSLDQIATQLSLSQKTVANYQSSLKQKLGVDSATQLLQAAHRLGLMADGGGTLP